MFLAAVPLDQPRITIRARATEPRSAPIFRLRFSRARAIPEKPGIDHRPTHPPHPAPASGPAQRDSRPEAMGIRSPP